MSYLNKPLKTKKIELKNRLVMPPMATSKSGDDGRISKDILNYYDEKSKGGFIGLVIIEHSFVSQQGKANNNQLSIANDDFVDDLKKLSGIIHKNGSKTIMQINHAGSTAMQSVTGMDVVGPSSVKNPSKDTAEMPRELTKAEINDIIEQFGKAALRVKKAGFDGVEIHSAHGYLLNQFMSPITNKRSDEYGGDLKGRIRIHLEIIREVRRLVGEDFPIFLRLGAADYLEGGTTVEDSKIAAVEFEKCGVDVIDISGGLCRYTLPGVNKEGYFADLSKEVKEAISIPVIVTGGITKVSSAESILSEKKADLIGVGRAIYRDSNWARKAMEIIND
jgi:NADPH2 dehydrogenase